MTNKAVCPIKNPPQFWDDEKRMNSLYSLIRPREVNVVDYDFKVSSWQQLILDWCLQKNKCSFTVKTIQEAFKRNERIPLGLITVVENLERNGHIKKKADFSKIDPDQTWREWAVSSLVIAPVWSFSKLMSVLMDVDETTIEYINLSYLKEKTKELTNKCSEQNKLYASLELKDLLTTEDGENISQECFEILIKWMRINNVIQTKQIDEEYLIKFGKNCSISDTELSIHTLEKNKLTLEKAILILEKEQEHQISMAKLYLKKGMRDMAKSYLRRKNEVEKTIVKRVNAVENIDNLLGRIHDTSTSSMVLDTYKVGVKALKASFEENGLSEEEAINTITEVEEVNEMHNEIQNALSEPISPNCDLELEEELKAILESEDHKEVKNLPDIPTETPKEKSLSDKEKSIRTMESA